MPHAATSVPTKGRAHELIDCRSPSQISSVVGILETMLGPGTHAVHEAPFEDEAINEERTVAESKEWRKTKEPISHDDVLAEFGLTMKDFDRMSQTPLEGCVDPE